MHRNTFITIVLVLITIALAWLFGTSGAAERFISFFSLVPWLAAFLAGVCFSSLFTAAPATVALGELASHWSLWQTALAGGLGALMGDLVLLELLSRFARRKTKKMGGIVKPPRFVVLCRIRDAMKNGPFRIVLWITGAIVIASPLPDEAGLALLGISKMPLVFFIPLSLFLNSVGIYVIGIIALSV